MYKSPLSEKMENQKFSEIAKIVFIKYNAILFALELQIDGINYIRLNPSNFVLRNVRANKMHGYLISSDN